MPDSGSIQFFATLDELVRTSSIVIDRPRSVVHPRIPHAVYPVDYGYLAGTNGGDGDGIDIFVGTDTDMGVNAVLLTADTEKRDAEIKLLLNCTPNETAQVRSFLVDVLHIGGHVVVRP